MANINSNRVSTVIDPNQFEGIKRQLQNIGATLSFLVGLTVEERIYLPKINDSNKTFVEDAFNAITNNTDMLPGYFSAEELRKDILLYRQLDELSLIIGQLYEKVNDTLMLAGSEAYVTSLTAYRLFDAAARGGIKGADEIYDRLKARFAEQGNFGKAVSEEQPQPPATDTKPNT